MKNEMRIPEAALRDSNSLEMLRVWIAEQSLWCSLRIGFYQDREINEPEAWGVILADATRHIANALAKQLGTNADATIELVRKSYDTELDRPTSPAEGGFAAPPN